MLRWQQFGAERSGLSSSNPCNKSSHHVSATATENSNMVLGIHCVCIQHLVQCSVEREITNLQYCYKGVDERIWNNSEEFNTAIEEAF